VSDIRDECNDEGVWIDEDVEECNANDSADGDASAGLFLSVIRRLL
jgi:hypothetical protein